MWTFAKHVGLCAAGLLALEASAQAQLQMAPGLNQNPYSAGASGSTTNNRFFNQGGTQPSGGGGGYSQFNLGPYASMSSSPNSNSGMNNPMYGGGGFAPYYNPWMGAYYNPQAGNLYGSAAVIDALSQQMTSVQQAYLMREQVRREKVENRRRIFEEWLYERNNTPSAQDEFERLQKLEIRRAQNDPPSNEIFSAKALNDLLKDVQRLQVSGAKGPNIPLDSDVIKNINFAPDGKGSANAGLLKNFKLDGQLKWPVTLKAPEFEKDRQLIERLTKDAIAQASSQGQVDFGTIKEMNLATERLGQGLKAALREGLPSTQYVPAKTFLANLDNSLKALSDPDAAKFVTGKFTAAGRNVEELVKDMTTKGLLFAPYVPGEEGAYLAIHRLLAAFDVSLNSMRAQQ